MGSLTIEMMLEGLVDDVGNGQAVKVSVASDRVDRPAFDSGGDALGLLGGIGGLGEGDFALVPPSYDVLQVRHHTDEDIVVYRWYTFCGQTSGWGNLGTFLSRCSHGRPSRARVYTRCTPTYTEYI